jgi:hypothetical protein
MTLYKYLTKERIDVIQNTSIRFTPPNEFNDPFEFKPKITSMMKNGAQNYMDVSNDDLIAHTKKIIKNKYGVTITEKKLKSLLKSKQPMLKHGVSNLEKRFSQTISDKLQDGFSRNIGILCLSEIPDNLLMWSHYSNSHTGFVIGFDENNDFFYQKPTQKSDWGWLRKVNYVDKRPNRSLDTTTSSDAFLSKNKIWEYEKEWRMMLPLKNADRIVESGDMKIHLFKIPEFAIKEIIFGAKCNNSFVNEVLEFIDNNQDLRNVTLYKSIENDSEYKLNITPFNF